MKIQLVARILVAFLWLTTLAVALCWIFWKDAPFEPEPITVVLGLVSTAVTTLLSEFSSRLEEEEFSLSYALAYGYVNNFIAPLITQLLKDLTPGSPPPRLFVYLPDSLSELEPASIQRLISRMRLKGFSDHVVNLQFQEGRARDVLSVSQNNGNPVYFDFPNTLLSLNSLINYKIESRKNSFSEAKRDEMARIYIRKFESVVREMVTAKRLDDFVHFVDNDLNFQS